MPTMVARVNKGESVMDRFKEVLGIAGILFVLGVVGLVLQDGTGKWGSDSGLLSLIISFIVLAGAAYLWSLWYHRKK